MQFCAVALRHDPPDPGCVPGAASCRFLLVCADFIVSSLLRFPSVYPQLRIPERYKHLPLCVAARFWMVTFRGCLLSGAAACSRLRRSPGICCEVKNARRAFFTSQHIPPMRFRRTNVVGRRANRRRREQGTGQGIRRPLNLTLYIFWQASVEESHAYRMLALRFAILYKVKLKYWWVLSYISSVDFSLLACCVPG